MDLEIFEDLAGEHNEASWGRRMPRVLTWFEEKRLSPAFLISPSRQGTG
jgi:hypothetical protein